jgi:hypothetical protein
MKMDELEMINWISARLSPSKDKPSMLVYLWTIGQEIRRLREIERLYKPVCAQGPFQPLYVTPKPEFPPNQMLSEELLSIKGDIEEPNNE